ncbi:class I SAM-dependent methyltransferase [Roseomonas rosulenta]|uniref:class I SAM-dependent methyltransferase n=1 Tax=Roseomonas rosulenta TaxID=2748667 RepID=UPI0018DFC768|nr:class I SAM-dependent methyltransferase [Roseomonas rosulenta]
MDHRAWPQVTTLDAALAQGFRQVAADSARHLWSCPDAEFLAAARPDPDWPRQYFGAAYAALAERFAGDPAARTRRDIATIRAVIAEHLAPRPRILDIPCGTGRHANALAAEGFDVIGLDLQPGYLRTARAEGSATYAAADMRALPVATGSIDLVLNMWNSLGYFLDAAEEAATLAEFRRVLRPGGKVLVQQDLDAPAALGGHWLQHMKAPLGDGAWLLVRQVPDAALGGLACLSWVMLPGQDPFQGPAFFLRLRDDAAWAAEAAAAGFAKVSIARTPPGVAPHETVVLLGA